MRKIIRLLVLVVVMVLSLCITTPALAAPPQGKVDCTVQPVIGGPDNPQPHTTPANVSIPANNSHISGGGMGSMPGNVFVPVDDILHG